MSANVTAHVVVEAEEGRGFHSLRCSHCGGLHMPETPITVEQLVAVCRGFVLMHRHCPKPVAASKQVELFNGLGEGPARLGNAYVGFPGYKRPPLEDAGDADPPEHDKPELLTYSEFETGHYAKFAQRYPAAKDLTALRVALGTVLSIDQLKSLSGKHLAKLHPSSAEFQDIAHWVRVAQARDESMASAQQGEPGEGGITIPVLPLMPPKLKEALGFVPKRAGKKAAPKRTRATAPNGSSA